MSIVAYFNIFLLVVFALALIRLVYVFILFYGAVRDASRILEARGMNEAEISRTLKSIVKEK